MWIRLHGICRNQAYTRGVIFGGPSHHANELKVYSQADALITALSGSDYQASRSSRSAPGGSIPGAHWLRGRLSPRASLHVGVKGKIPSCAGNQTSVVQPIARHCVGVVNHVTCACCVLSVRTEVYVIEGSAHMRRSSVIISKYQKHAFISEMKLTCPTKCRFRREDRGYDDGLLGRRCRCFPQFLLYIPEQFLHVSHDNLLPNLPYFLFMITSFYSTLYNLYR